MAALPMYTIIGQDQKEYGPVEREKILKWVREGRVNGQTRVKADGNEQWLALEAMPEFAEACSVPAGHWRCAKCGELIENQFDSCWKCSSRPGEQPSEQPAPAIPPATGNWEVQYKVFRARLASWDELFAFAARFATEIGRDRLIGISHSEDHNDGVVTVWFWAETSSPPTRPEAEQNKAFDLQGA